MSFTPRYGDAVLSLIGTGGSGPTDGPISDWVFDVGVITPTEEEIDTELIRLQAAYDAQAYARSRQAEYPPLEDQLDHIYHNGVASWKANVVKPVKDKYPKPG